MSHPDHPIWGIVNTSVLGVIAIGALYVTASHFDETEVKAWAPMITAIGGSEMIRHYVRKKTAKGDGNGST